MIYGAMGRMMSFYLSVNSLSWDTTKLIDITATHLSDISKDVKLEASILILNGKEQTIRKTSKLNDEVRFNICARSFWVSGQKVFFDLRFFDPSARMYSKRFLERKWKETPLKHFNNDDG